MRPRAVWAKDRGTWFYLGAAIVGLVASLVGFHLTYTRPVLTGAYEGPWWGHLHGAASMAWILLTIAQSWLAPRKLKWHRTLGWAALAIIPLWFASTVMIAREFGTMEIAAGRTDNAMDNIGGAIASPLVVMLMIGLAIWFRKKPQAHKRLIFIGTVVMLWPSWSRWRHWFPDPDAVDQLFAFFIALAWIPVAMLRDKVKFGAIHPALLWGGVFVLVEQSYEVLAHGTRYWTPFSHLMYRWIM